MVGSPPPAVDSRDASPRVIVLGASNVAISLGTILATARQIHGGPVELLATPAHGRSYGLSTSFLGRRLAGITSCGLWDELAAKPDKPTFALVTDIGNDLLYNVSIQQIMGWLKVCLDRLTAAGAQIAITRLPIESVTRLPRHRYRLLRRLMFPTNRTSLDVLLHQATELDHQVQLLGRQYEATVFDVPGAWYGFDPIHIQRRSRPIAWSNFLAAHIDRTCLNSRAKLTWRERMQIRRLRPHERTVRGRIQRHLQPAGRLRDGTTVGLY